MRSLPGLTPDGERIVTSDDILRRTDVPKSVVVVGAGAVGVEFASFYHDIGTAVTVLEYLPDGRARSRTATSASSSSGASRGAASGS